MGQMPALPKANGVMPGPGLSLTTITEGCGEGTTGVWLDGESAEGCWRASKVSRRPLPDGWSVRRTEGKLRGRGAASDPKILAESAKIYARGKTPEITRDGAVTELDVRPGGPELAARHVREIHAWGEPRIVGAA
jgi:hypothetical protein